MSCARGTSDTTWTAAGHCDAVPRHDHVGRWWLTALTLHVDWTVDYQQLAILGQTVQRHRRGNNQKMTDHGLVLAASG